MLDTNYICSHDNLHFIDLCVFSLLHIRYYANVFIINICILVLLRIQNNWFMQHLHGNLMVLLIQFISSEMAAKKTNNKKPTAKKKIYNSQFEMNSLRINKRGIIRYLNFKFTKHFFVPVPNYHNYKPKNWRKARKVLRGSKKTVSGIFLLRRKK